jgi:hypothetical protein
MKTCKHNWKKDGECPICLCDKRVSTSALSDVLVAALGGLATTTCEFLKDWRKGDFDLPRLAQLDAEAMEEAAIKVKAILKEEGY